MKLVPLALVALAGLTPLAVTAGDPDTSIEMEFDPPAHWEDLHRVEDAQLAITTQNRKVTLLQTRRVVAVQLSERVLGRVRSKIREAKEDDDDGALGKAIKTAVLAGVKSLLNHSVEVDIRDIARADYRDGEILLIDHKGRKIFANAKVDEQNVMRGYAAADARAFVKLLRQRMARAS